LCPHYRRRESVVEGSGFASDRAYPLPEAVMLVAIRGGA
jgi:hypothetical protein